MNRFLVYASVFFAVAMGGASGRLTVGVGLEMSADMTLWATCLVVVLADLLPCSFWFLLGRALAHFLLLEKWGLRLGLTPGRRQKFQEKARLHAKKTIILAESTPYVGGPTIAILGTTNVNFGLFFVVTFFWSLARNAVCLFLGYYFGKVIRPYVHDFRDVVMAVMVLIILSFLYHQVRNYIHARREDED